MQKIDELDKPPVVGRFYLVPCFRLAVLFDEEWIPVHGSAHDDPEIGVLVLHRHVDARFVSKRLQKKLDLVQGGSSVLAVPVCDSGSVKVKSPVYRKMKCRRTMPAIEEFGPIPGEMTGTIRTIHRCGVNPERPVCPHRGYDLRTIPEVNGVVTCPLHGLAFDAETGAPMWLPSLNKENTHDDQR